MPELSTFSTPLVQPALDPLSTDKINQLVNIPYTTTLPNYSPTRNGVRVVYNDANDYWLYIYANGGWRVSKLEADYREIQCVVYDPADSLSTGDGKFYIHAGQAIQNMNLVYAHAEVITAGTTNTTDIQIANVTQAVDMLTTKLTIDSGETGSDEAVSAVIIDTA